MIDRMRMTSKTYRLVIVTIAFLATAVLGYAQKPGTDNVNENMLRYRYVDKMSRKVKFSIPQTFDERIYLFAGTGIEDLYQVGNHPESPGYAIGSSIGLGFWATPLHGVEAAFSYGMMPYGYWGENFLGQPVIDNTIIKNVGFEANYVLISSAMVSTPLSRQYII